MDYNGFELTVRVVKVTDEYTLTQMIEQLENSISELIGDGYNDGLVLLGGKAKLIEVNGRD